MKTLCHNKFRIHFKTHKTEVAAKMIDFEFMNTIHVSPLIVHTRHIRGVSDMVYLKPWTEVSGLGMSFV